MNEPRKRYSIVVIGLTLGIAALAVVVARPRVNRWLTLRSAYQNLASDDFTEQRYAMHVLLEHGENPDESLIALLHHSSEGTRRFAAQQLAHRPITGENIQALLNALESARDDPALAITALDLFLRHAEASTGPLTASDQRMIALLRPIVAAEENLYVRNRAALIFAAIVHRDPTVRDALIAYLDSGDFKQKLPIACEFASHDAKYRDWFVDFLLSDTMSADENSRPMAIQYLWRLSAEAPEVVAPLKARRAETHNRLEMDTIDRALELIQAGPPPTK